VEDLCGVCGGYDDCVDCNGKLSGGTYILNMGFLWHINEMYILLHVTGNVTIFKNFTINLYISS
jgi:hypothetical protein